MTQLTVADLNNAKLDVNTIANIANSTAETVTDRNGQTRRTIYSLSNEYLTLVLTRLPQQLAQQMRHKCNNSK